MCDGVHPNAEGYKIVANLVYKTLFDPTFDSREMYEPGKNPKDEG